MRPLDGRPTRRERRAAWRHQPRLDNQAMAMVEWAHTVRHLKEPAMSLARIKSTRAAKSYTCEKCHAEIEKGQQYLSYKVGFRSRFVHRRHVGCRPRNSEIESSKLADVYSAQEDAEDALAAIDHAQSGSDATSEIEQIIEELSSRVGEVQSEYDDAATDENGTEWNLDAAERRDILEAVVSELDSFSADDQTTDCGNCEGTGRYDQPDREDGGADCDECDGSGQVADVEAMVEAALEVVQGMEF